MLLILGNREPGMLYVGFDLRKVQVNESIGGTFAYKQFRAGNMTWRH